MMFTHKNLMTVCCAAVLAFGLAACGSSSDDDNVAVTTPMMDGDGDADAEQSPMEPTAAEQLATAQAAVAEAKTTVEALPATSSPADRAAAYSSLATAQAALAEASGIPENEIALLTAEIARLQGVIEQAATDAQVEADRIAAEMTAEADRIAALVAGTASAETKEKAIDAEDGTAGLGGIGDDADTVWTLGISRDSMATKIEIGDPANPAGADPENPANPQFALAMDLGNGRTMHTREMEATDDGDVVTEVVIVATDIAAPRAVAFAKFEVRNAGGEVTTPQVLNFNTDTTNDPDDGVATNEALIVDTANSALIAAARFTAGTVAELSFDFDVDGTANMDEADEVVGTYNGAMGTYRCTGTAVCTVDINAMGKVEKVGDGWIFTPDSGATSDQPDYDYLNYGFWLQKTADEDGVLTYDEVQTFAGSSVDASGSVAAVTGSATYNGGATGVYVHSEVNSDGSPVATTAGQFAADASLTATFAQTVNDPETTVDESGRIPPNLVNTLTGTIDDFVLQHGEENTWAVNLQGAIDPSDGTVTSADGATGGGAPGSWSATFHGSTTDEENAATVLQPSSVVGEFNANFSNGSVAGGFGARK